MTLKETVSDMIVKNSEGHYINLAKMTEFFIVQHNERALNWCVVGRNDTQWFGGNDNSYAMIEDFGTAGEARQALDWLMNQMVMGRNYVDMLRDYFDGDEREDEKCKD